MNTRLYRHPWLGRPLAWALLLSLSGLLPSCGLFKNIMLKPDDQLDEYTLTWQRDQAEQNYLLKPGDRFTFRVTTNEGELLIDPDFELQRQLTGGQVGQMNLGPVVYQIFADGQAVLPRLDTITLSGYSLREADSLLNVAYSHYYTSPYVRIALENRRVVVLGGASQAGKVIPLENEQMHLLEVLALYGGIDRRAKADNIRIIRGDLSKPQVQIIDLTTLRGMTQADLRVQPGDIIYIEPQKRVVSESFSEFGPILNIFTSVITLIVLIATLNNR